MEPEFKIRRCPSSFKARPSYDTSTLSTVHTTISPTSIHIHTRLLASNAIEADRLLLLSAQTHIHLLYQDNSPPGLSYATLSNILALEVVSRRCRRGNCSCFYYMIGHSRRTRYQMDMSFIQTFPKVGHVRQPSFITR